MGKLRTGWIVFSVLVCSGSAGAQAPVQQQYVGTVEVPATGKLSAAVFDNAGNLVRTLLQTKAVTAGQSQDLFWDYRDETFVHVPAWRGPFEWRALVSNATATDEGSIGNTGLPGIWNGETHPAYGATSAPNAVFAVANDSSDNLYTVSGWEENGHALNKLAPDGAPIWSVNRKGVSVAVNAQYVFVSAEPIAASGAFDDRIFRLTTDGADAPFPTIGSVLVNASKVKPFPNNARLTLTQSREWRPLHLAAFDNRLIVSNYLTNSIEVYDATSGAAVSSTFVDAPIGVATDSAGGIWIANSSDRVTHFDWSGTNYVAGTTITGLSDPDGVAFNRRCNGTCVDHLYVSQMGAHSIREFDVSTSPAFVRDIGHAAAPGALEPDGFFFGVTASVAADSQGTLSVTDSANHRVQRFYDDGSLFDSFHADHTAAPYVEAVDSTHHRILSGSFEYEVDLATAHSDWQGDGKWRLAHNWQPRDGAFHSGASVRRRLEVSPGVTRDFIFYLGGNYAGVAVYVVEPAGLRRVAIVGGAWPGYDDRDPPTTARYVWLDEDGDGNVEDDEVAWDAEPGDPSGFRPYFAVDDGGNIIISAFWNGYNYNDVIRLNLAGFEATTTDSNALNPVFSWSPSPTFRDTLVSAQPKEFWNELGTYELAAGSSTYIEFSNSGADSTVSADAIRLVDEFGAETILDTQDAGSGTPYVPGPPAATGSVSVSGNWASSSTAYSSAGNTYLHDGNSAATSLKTLRFLPNVPHAGTFRIFHRQTPHTQRASNTQITIQAAQRRDTFRFNQRLDDQGGFNHTSVALGPSGELFALGTTPAAAALPLGQLTNAGSSIVSYASNGLRLQSFTFPRNELQEQVVVDPVSSDYCYSGGKNDLNLWSVDGLSVVHLQPGAANGYVGGWIDHPYGISVVHGADADQRYVYAEGVYDAKSIRYRVDGLGTVQRLSGAITPADTGTGRSQPVLIIDTDDPTGSHITVRGAWGKSANQGELGSSYWHDSNSLKGEKLVTWTPLIKDPGRYRVSLRRISNPVYDSNVPVTIHHVDGDTLVAVNQKLTGSPWIELGTWGFREGMSGSVTISNAGTTAHVVADSVMLELVQTWLTDSEDATGVTLMGTWSASSGIAGFHGTNYRHDNNSLKGSKSVSFAPTLPATRSYDVYARWTEHFNRASNVPYDVSSLAGMTTLTLDQRDNGSIWNPLGTYDFAAGTGGTVTIRNAGTNGFVVADAVKVEPTLTVVSDNVDGVVIPGTFTPPDCSTSATSRIVGNWTISGAVPGYQGANYLSDGNAASQKGAKRVCFKPSLVDSRNYAVYLRWTASLNRASNVPIDIRHALGTTRLIVDQRVDGAQWNYLGTFPLTNDGASFIEILTDGTDGFVIADAVQLR